MSLAELVDISRRVGEDPEWVLAGGGNTSFKDEQFLYVKASGYQLATITEDGFARMDRARLQAIWDKEYPTDVPPREATALDDLMAARVPGEERRPSVETLMHELFPFSFVIHTHPAIVNGLTCSQDGAAMTPELFGGRALWMPVVNPGYVLAVRMREAADRYATQHGAFPRIVLIQNHGLVVAGNTVAQIDETHELILSIMRSAIGRAPDANGIKPDDPDATERWQAAVVAALPEQTTVRFLVNNEIRRLTASAEVFERIRLPFSPDHIVYAGPELLYLTGDVNAGTEADAVASAVADYRARHEMDPKVMAIGGVGCFAVGPSEKAARASELLFRDAIKVATYAEAFGGPSPLPNREIAFIRDWEVEKFRTQQSTA